MGIVSSAAPVATKTDPSKSRNTCPNTKTRLQIRGANLLIILTITLRTMQCGVGQVAGQAPPPTEAPSETGLQPTVGPEAPMVGEPPQLSSPPLSPPQGQFLQFQQVLSSLRSNNYTIGAQYISDYLFLLPVNTTVFVPTNAAFYGLNGNLALGPLLAYQAILQQLSYEQLLLFPVGTRFPSFVGNNNTVVITSVAPDSFRVDDVRIVQGNICSSSTSALQISCHGLDGVLNMTLWGETGLAQLAPVPSPASEAPLPELTPPAILPPPENSAPAPAPEETPPDGVASRAESRCTCFSVLYVYVFAAVLAL